VDPDPFGLAVLGAVGPLRKNAAEVSIGDLSQEP